MKPIRIGPTGVERPALRTDTGAVPDVAAMA
jgi:hypothetical protein